MPPKPPIRIPVKQAPTIRSRTAPSPASKPPKPASTTKPPPRTTWYQNAKSQLTPRLLTRYAINGVIGFSAGLFIRDNFFDFDKVSGASMAPTINPTVHETGQRDVVFTRSYTHHEKAINVESGLAGKDKSKGWGVSNGGIKRGDVVTFWKPHKPEEIGIKRVIAVEGDVVWPKNGYAMSTSAQAERLSGMPDGLPDHDPDSVLSGREEKGRVVVPYGHVWVEGDNWRMSLDSRDNGPMAKGLIMGKVVGIWRGWGEFRGTRDERKALEKQGASRVEEGRSEVPSVFLE